MVEDDMRACEALAPSVAIVTALEALGFGDQAEAVAVLQAALEDAPRPVGVSCPDCGQRFDWPGLLDRHLIDCAAGRELWERSAA